MATRKKAKQPAPKARKKKPQKKPARRKAPAARKRPRKPVAPPEALDPDATQRVPVAEIIGDIEEQLAIARIKEG
jgi:hypothetical protein